MPQQKKTITAAGTGPLLGSHMSTEGGLFRAIERAEELQCTALQLFVKNSNQWKAKPLSEREVETYKTTLAKSNIRSVIVHDTYLINLCATNPDTLKKSREAYKDELLRCDQLGIPAYNFHPGAHVGQGEEEGIKRIAESLNIIHSETNGCNTLSVLETTAGQGTNLGYTFEQLRKIIDLVEDRQRMAVCIDTCHIFAAGYDIRTEEGYERTMRQFIDIIGVKRLAAFHLNDSKKEFGSRVDRHEHIGKGAIGRNSFRWIMTDDRWKDVPKIIETEKDDEGKFDRMNLELLRSFAKK